MPALPAPSLLLGLFGLLGLGLGLPRAAKAAPPVGGATGPAREAGAASERAADVEMEGPMRPEAGAHYLLGLERFGTRDYAAAVAEFEAGYAVEPRREFLFAEAQAKRLGGDCRDAVPLYQRFLATHPPPVQVNATQMALGRCAQQLAAQPKLVVVAAPAPLPLPQPQPQPQPPPPRPPSWWRDPWGIAFTAAGVASLGVGAGFLAGSFRAQDDAHAAGSYAGYEASWSTAGGRRTVGIGMLSLGTALTAVGVWRFVDVRRYARGRELALSVGPGTISLAGGF